VRVIADGEDVTLTRGVESLCNTAAGASNQVQLNDLERVRGFETRERACLPCRCRRPFQDDRDRTRGAQRSSRLTRSRALATTQNPTTSAGDSARR
jgi:hypothetical protein